MLANTGSCSTCSLKSLFFCVFTTWFLKPEKPCCCSRRRPTHAATHDPARRGARGPLFFQSATYIALTHDTVTRGPMRHIYHVCFLSPTIRSRDSCGRTTQKITSPAARRGCASGHGTAGARPVEAVAGCAPRPRARRSRERRLAAARGCVVANCIAQAEVRCVRGNRAERGPRQTARACGSAGAPAAGAAAVAGHWTPPAKRVPARVPARCRLR